MARETDKSKSMAQRMAEFAFGLRYDSVPADVITAARRHLADTLACALGAHAEPIILALRKDAIARGGRADATIIGTAEKVPAAVAGLINGTMTRHLDANDTFVLSRGGPSGHCSDGTLALLALAEKYRRSGEELLLCLIASYELQGALAESVNFWERGFHAETNVAWVVPLVAARLVGATPAEAVHACGLAVATSTVLNTWLRPGRAIPMIKGVVVGLVLERVIEAAELAALGVTATEDALEIALAEPASNPALEFDPAGLDQLGKRWTTTRHMIKPYPAQLYTQAAIEAVLKLFQQGIRAETVQKLTLHGHRSVCAGVQGSAQAFTPTNRESADHSTPYVMAMALLRGRLTPEEYEGAPWESADVKAVMAKIELRVDAQMDQGFVNRGMLGVRLVAELLDGRTETISVRQPKGHPDAPLSEEELVEKMSWLLRGASSVLTPRRLLDLCNRLSTAEDVKELIESCSVAAE
jgi:2-methylcitrate dehydratase